jgi:hypothetical protein
LENLPIGQGRRAQKRNPNGFNIVAAHHYDANTVGKNKWNAADRFSPMPQLLQNHEQNDCIVWEVGAHKQAADSATLMQTYPNCTYHAFEPIPAYFKVLQGNWKVKADDSSSRNNNNMHLHNFGIGARDAVLHVAPESLQEQATYIGDSVTAATDDGDNNSNNNNKASSFMQVQIKSFANAMAETAAAAASDAGVGRQRQHSQYPTLLHMNCEGCEWETCCHKAWMRALSNVYPSFRLDFTIMATSMVWTDACGSCARFGSDSP